MWLISQAHSHISTAIEGRGWEVSPRVVPGPPGVLSLEGTLLYSLRANGVLLKQF